MPIYDTIDIVLYRIHRVGRSALVVKLDTPVRREDARIRADVLEQYKAVMRVDCYTTKGTFI